ncbi:hypothetical protein HJC99_04045 [Candidatus Saccharibacteria bacterium]|nr:hypothetical protein [Candidatus Saccharibacteria bacterium]
MELYILGGLVVALAIGLVIQQIRIERTNRKLAELATKPKPVVVSEPTALELENKLKAAYEAKIGEATQAFATDLTSTSAKLSELVSRLTTDVIEKELDAYHKTLDGVRATANEAMEKIRAAVDEQRVELRKGMEADVAAEQNRLIERFDTKMGDVVSSYIAESLGGGVDLGAQMQYVISSLEAHKEEIKKDLYNGV